jgi:hypothetical protein
MKKMFTLLPAAAVVVGLFCYATVESVRAIPPFKKEFDNKYVKKDSSDPNEKALAEAVEKVKCNVCHKGKDKKMRNAYGEELAKLLDKKADAKNPEKIQQALDKVAALPSNPSDPKSPTYGDLLKEGKLPAPEKE